MGHKRLGLLPKTAEWREVVCLLGGAELDPDELGGAVTAVVLGLILADELERRLVRARRDGTGRRDEQRERGQGARAQDQQTAW